MNIFVGNLPEGMTAEELRETFEVYGDVASARLVSDPATGASRGCGFVEMMDKAQAEAALVSLNLKQFRGRVLTAREARESVGRGRGEDRQPTRIFGRRG